MLYLLNERVCLLIFGLIIFSLLSSHAFIELTVLKSLGMVSGKILLPDLMILLLITFLAGIVSGFLAVIVVALFVVSPFTLFTFLYSSEYYSRQYERIFFMLCLSCSSIYFSFLLLLLSVGTALSLKVFLSSFIFNFIDLYIFGLLAVCIHWLFPLFSFGWLLFAFLFFLYLHRSEVFLFVLSLLESFSTLFQSLTLSNRLSINLLSGSLLIELLTVAVRFNYFLLFFLFIIFSVEILNSVIQLFIFSLLHLEYYL